MVSPQTWKEARMHVLMVTNAVAPDKLGGLERYVAELSSELVHQGHLVTVIARRTSIEQSPVEQLPNTVRVRRYDIPSKRDPFFVLKYPILVVTGVRRALREAISQSGSQATIIHGHFPLPMVYPFLRKLPYIYTCHAPVYKEILDERLESYPLPAAIQRVSVAVFKAVERRIIGNARQVVTLSEFVRSEVTDLTAKRPESIARIPGGLDTTWFSPGVMPTVPGDPTSGPNLFTARRLVRRTGVEELIRAMPLILERKPYATLTIAGDGPLREHLQDVLEELDLREAVQMVGRVSDAVLRDWYRRADIAVTPTRNLEGFGLSTVEAMACGTVPLVTPVAANQEVVGEISALLVAPAADANGIAEGVLRLWEAPDFLSIRASVRRVVHPRLGWSDVSRQYLRIYREVLETNSGPHVSKGMSIENT